MIKPRTVKKYTTTIVIKRVNVDYNYYGFCDYSCEYLWNEDSSDEYCTLFDEKLEKEISPYGIRCCVECNSLCSSIPTEITEE